MELIARRWVGVTPPNLERTLLSDVNEQFVLDFKNLRMLPSEFIWTDSSVNEIKIWIVLDWNNKECAGVTSFTNFTR